jgi:hypothetical protein
MAVSSRELAAALAVHLDAVAPAGFRVRADGRQVTVYRAGRVVGGTAAPQVMDDPGDERRLAVAAWSTISGVQDVFAEELTEPWPAPGGDMPPPEVRVEDGVLFAWFGSAENPAVALTPYTLRAG